MRASFTIVSLLADVVILMPLSDENRHLATYWSNVTKSDSMTLRVG